MCDGVGDALLVGVFDDGWAGNFESESGAGEGVDGRNGGKQRDGLDAGSVQGMSDGLTEGDALDHVGSLGSGPGEGCVLVGGRGKSGDGK